MNEESKRKAIILTFIGALTLLFVVVGGTFAYFQIVNTDEGSTNTDFNAQTDTLNKYGTPLLTKKSDLYISLSASDMAYSKKGTSYWATETKDPQDIKYESEKQNHIISTASIERPDGDNIVEDAYLKCTSELTITIDGTMKDVLQTGDGTLYLGTKSSDGNSGSIEPESFDLAELVNKQESGENKATVNYEITGFTSVDVTADIEIVNREAIQNALAGKNIEITITNNNLSCSVSEKEDKAYMKKLVTVQAMLDSEGEEYIYAIEEYYNSIKNIQFVKYVPSDDELSSKTKYWDLTDTELSSEKSIIGWLENTSNDDGNYDLYIGSKDTIYATNLSYAFYYMTNLKEINFENLNTSETTDMSYMFAGSEIDSLDLSNFDTSSVTDMHSMFSESGANITFPQGFGSATTDMSWMFGEYKGTTLDLSNFDTSKVTNMNSMFASHLPMTMDLEEIIGLENFVTTKVTDMGFMFAGNAEISTLDLSSFDTSQVTNMMSMFEACGSLRELDLSSFIFDNVADFSSMFEGGSDVPEVPNDIHIKVKQGQDEFIRERLSEGNVTNPNVEVVS